MQININAAVPQRMISFYTHQAFKIHSSVQHTNTEWVEAKEIFAKNLRRVRVIWGIMRFSLELLRKWAWVNRSSRLRMAIDSIF
jgi:hypothetical protein